MHRAIWVKMPLTEQSKDRSTSRCLRRTTSIWSKDDSDKHQIWCIGSLQPVFKREFWPQQVGLIPLTIVRRRYAPSNLIAHFQYCQCCCLSVAQSQTSSFWSRQILQPLYALVMNILSLVIYRTRKHSRLLTDIPSACFRLISDQMLLHCAMHFRLWRSWTSL